MSGINFIPSFSFYNLATALASPYTSFSAYSNGAIDQNGNVLTNEASIDPFEYFVIKLKKIFDQLPYGTTRYKLGNVIGVLELFSEEATNFGIKKEEFNCLVEEHFSYVSNNEVSYFQLLEDMTAGGGGAGSLGTPASGGAGVNTGSVSGFDPRMGSMMSREGPVNMISSVEMFNVSDDEFNQFKQAKAWRHLKDSETKRYLQRFQRRNKDGKMAVRNPNTGEIHWLKYNEKSLIEELNLISLDILKETVMENPISTDSVLDNLQRDFNDGLQDGLIEPNVENPHHVSTFYDDSITALRNDKSKSAHAAMHEHRSRLALAVLGMRTSELDHLHAEDTGRENAHQNFFKSLWQIKGKSASSSDKADAAGNKTTSDLVAYNSATGKPIKIDAKRRWEAKETINPSKVFSSLNPQQRIAFGKTSSVRPSSSNWADIVGGASESLLQQIGKRLRSFGQSGSIALGTKGKSPKTFVLTRNALKNIASGLHATRVLGGIRGMGTSSRIQPQINPVETAGQVENLRKQAGVHSREFTEIYLTDDDLEHAKTQMLGSETSKEHKDRVERVHRDMIDELTKGGLYKPGETRKSLSQIGLHI